MRPNDLLPAERGHIDSLDGLRAIAAFVVLTFHVAYSTADLLTGSGGWRVVAHGDVGVPIFFALSGLLLYRPWWEGTGPHGLGQMWSLSTEVAFYALLPIIAAALASYAHYDDADVDTRARRLLTALGVLSLGSLVWIAIVHNTAYGYYYELWLPRSICWFAAGMAITVLTEWSRAERGSPHGPVGRLCRTIAFMPGVCWLVAATAWGLASTPLAGPAFLQGTPSVLQSEIKTVLYLVIALGLVAPAACQPGGNTITTALLGNKVMRFLGKISYGVFLWQFVIIYAWYELTDRPFWNHDFWVVLPVVLAGTVAAAIASFYLIERPAQRLKTVSSRWAVTLPEPPRPAEPPAAPPPSAPAVDARTGRWQRGH